MNNKFDQLAKGVAQAVTRRQAVKRFGYGLTAMALAYLGLSSKADPQPCLQSGSFCENGGSGPAHVNCHKCCSGSFFCERDADGVVSCFCN